MAVLADVWCKNGACDGSIVLDDVTDREGRTEPRRYCLSCSRDVDEDGYPTLRQVGADTTKHGAHQMKVNRARY